MLSLENSFHLMFTRTVNSLTSTDLLFNFMKDLLIRIRTKNKGCYLTLRNSFNWPLYHMMIH